MGTQSASAYGTIAGSAAAPVVGTLAGIGGIATNAIVGARNLWRGGRAWMHKRRVDAAAKHADVTGASPAVQGAAAHHSSQMASRRWRAGVGVGGAALGIAGGAAALALGLSNPIGWALMGAGALAAAGLGAYKLGRWAYKRFGKENTLGKDRDKHADTLVNALHGDSEDDRKGAQRIVDARLGDDPKKKAKFAEATPAEKKAFLLDKTRSW